MFNHCILQLLCSNRGHRKKEENFTHAGKVCRFGAGEVEGESERKEGNGGEVEEEHKDEK